MTQQGGGGLITKKNKSMTPVSNKAKGKGIGMGMHKPKLHGIKSPIKSK